MNRQEQVYKVVKEFCGEMDYFCDDDMRAVKYIIGIEDDEMGFFELVCQLWVKSRSLEISIAADDNPLNKIQDIVILLNKINDVAEATFIIDSFEDCFKAKVNLDFERRDISVEDLEIGSNNVLEDFMYIYPHVIRISNGFDTQEEISKLLLGF